MTTEESSPSASRRQALRKANEGTTMRVLDSYPLDRYLDMGDRLLDTFQQAVDARELDQAYIYGLRFASFCVDTIPKHKDYKLAVNRKRIQRVAQKLEKVVSILEIVTQRMDAEELVLQERKRQQLEIERQRKEEEEQKRLRDEQLKQEEIRAEKLAIANVQKTAMKQSALAKLQALQRKIDTPQEIPKQSESQARNATSEASGTPEAAAPVPAPADTKNQTVSKSATSVKIPINQPPEPTSSVTKTTHQPEQDSEHDVETSTSPVESSKKGVEDGTGEAQRHEPKQAAVDSASTASKVVQLSKDETQEEPTVASTPLKPTVSRDSSAVTPRTAKEQATLDLLQRAIEAQEKRIEEIESRQIPSLLAMARKFARKDANSNRKEALQCLARKKALARQADLAKTAIFNMETQLFMLENAMEDRQVQKALEDASQAMRGLQEDVAEGVDLTDLTTSIPENVLVDVVDNDDELLDELQELLEPGSQQGEKASHGDALEDDISLLSLPNVPVAPELSRESSNAETPQTNEESPSMGKLLKAVLG
eukprot:Nitzschia sp. Nitz4//scaffold7_size249615//28732//30351//NITZ4_001142-RA/size249615-processed-gene-0.174-mRNA-1//-1//CDS//3329558337//1319//frame0